MTKAYAYCRCSGVGQISGDTWERQIGAINAYAAVHGFEVVRVFRDEGVSGTLADRPGLGELLLSLAENGVKTVLIEKLDRLARDLMVSEMIVADFQKQGFNLVSVHEGDDLLSSDPTRVLIRQIFSAFAAYEKSMLVLKLKAARDRIRASGKRCEGQVPFVEKNPAVVARVIELRAGGLSQRLAAEALNAEGLSSSRGRAFTRKIVDDIEGRLEHVSR